MLAEALRRRWPRLAVAVVNQGVGGDTAKQMLARFTRDVLRYHPQLVIWQTGSNSALASEDLQGYEHTVRAGLAQLQAAQIDVILMDPQYAPRVLERPLHRAIVNILAKLGDDLQVAVFHRFAVMQQWVTKGQYSIEDLIIRDQLHMSDTGYTCIAQLLSRSLVSAVLATPPQPTDDSMTMDSSVHIGTTPEP
jgi:lysophospholipase L1-like esterase